MNRRDVLKSAALGALVVAWGKNVFAKEYYPAPVDESLFKGINRLENPQNESELAKLHVPVINAPEKVKAGEIFSAQVAVGKILHPMKPVHWIEHLQVNIGNEPAATLIFRSHGYMKPEGKFNLVLGDDLKGKTVSVVVQDKCNIHGLWQGYVNVQVA